MDALAPLQPRLYSITAAPEVHPGKPSVAFSVVKYGVPSGAEAGPHKVSIFHCQRNLTILS